MSEKLKPCPFCGGDAVFNGESYHFGGQVECQNSDCEVIGPFRDAEHDAVVAWNTRAPILTDAQ